MISVFPGTHADPAVPVVVQALRRSVGNGPVRVGIELSGPGVTVFVSPTDDQAALVDRAARGGNKVLVLGAIGPKIADRLGLGRPTYIPNDWVIAAQCDPAAPHQTSQSDATVVWSGEGLAAASPFRRRPLLRYDFADEWNNLGYGRTQGDGGQWGLAVAVTSRAATTLANVVSPGLDPLAFVTILDTSDASLLWWNRPVGPVDNWEWFVVETFLSQWRPDELTTLPVIEEIPFGYDTVSTMRLDCDEDIASARPLFELYRSRGIPFSVAIKTGQEERPEDLSLLKDIYGSGGAILSHSVTHAPNWGGSEDSCVLEARKSSDWLEQRVGGLKVRNAVSPFHQNPSFVPGAIKKAGLTGFIGGIVANDPEALLARGGFLPGDDSGVVSHSQQCMLHGDCLLAEGDALAVPKAAADAAFRSRSLFGYLDHPFSARYDYGWGSERARLDAHSDYLDYLSCRTSAATHIWLNEDDVLDWIGRKSRIQITAPGRGEVFSVTGQSEGELQFAVRWRGQTMSLRDLPRGS